ncbi:Threonine--tRNA ligase [bioreactor metagenome]|uniref:Threonine--tRNA ligase n=1 Tax=bioreactor metagenome TaxID=1076179 RepID=A0A645EFY2_9ZZZZ
MLPISEDFFEYANEVKTELATHGVRVEIDCRDEKLGKKIRDAQIQKIPYMVVLGEKEASSKQVAPRDRSKGDLGAMSINDFVKVLEEEFNPLICK